MTDTEAAAPPESVALPVRLAGDLAALEKELGEIELLVAQATAEAARHEARRAQAAEKVSKPAEGEPEQQLAEQFQQVLTLTQRAALMQSQVDVLEGKKRALTRYRDALAAYVEASAVSEATAPEAQAFETPALGTLSPDVARLLLNSQEELRREIARAMHDGPAQSLTNIVLQAQIVERLVAGDPAAARGEVRQLVAMVQQTLDATKSFIFDVRPMVLDDLGLAPTLRRAARDRGRRAGVDVEFESQGAERRLPMELESGLFRILDEALTAYLAQRPDHVVMALDWSERLDARIRATRGLVAPAGMEDGSAASAADATRPESEELPPALAAMIEDRREDERHALEAAERDSIVALPGGTWRELETRAATLGIAAELSADGSEIRISADLPGFEESAAG